MGDGGPIVASDLPSLREIIDESTAYFFEPDNSESLARAVKAALEREAESQEKARKALELVRKFSWQKRAEAILRFINKT